MCLQQGCQKKMEDGKVIGVCMHSTAKFLNL